MGGEILKKFGRYFLLDQIAQGGMAEIYRARLASADGAGRLMVIKRIQAGYGANEEFLQMFKSEIKVTMAFNHPNIVQLYDFGEENHQPFIAMELVDGKNLRQFLNRFNELKQNFPVDLAAHIIEQSASALHYAHTFRDKISGQPLQIVHRDISPQNILIAYEGGVKVIDFGIAKATTNLENTRAGVIKGKPSYLSPEQINGDPLDGRCDIFALGTVLWELLTGKKLFAGENDLAVLKLIEGCTTHVKAPSVMNPNVPKELDYIVLKALAKQREKRYQTAEELQRALHKFLYTFNSDFNPSDLAYHSKGLFKDEIVEDRKRIQRLNDRVEELLLLDVSSQEQGGDSLFGGPGGVKKEDTTTIVEPRRAREKVFENIDPNALKAGVELDGASVASIKNSRPSKTPRHTLTSAKTPLAPSQLPPRPTSGPGARTRTQAPPAPMPRPNIYHEPQSGGAGRKAALVAAAVAAVIFVGPQLGITIPGLTSQSTERKPDSVPAASPEKAAASKESKMISLNLNIVPGGAGASVLVNSKPVKGDKLVAQVALDAPIDLLIERPGFRSFHREFVLESKQLNGLKEWPMEIQLEPTKFGFITIRAVPSADATIMINGSPWVTKTPLENRKLPVGTYQIKLANDVLGMEKTVTVSIQEGKAVNIDERLQIKN